MKKNNFVISGSLGIGRESKKLSKHLECFFFNVHLKNYFKVGNMTELTKITIITKALLHSWLLAPGSAILDSLISFLDA